MYIQADTYDNDILKRRCHLFKRIRNEYGASNSRANRQLSGEYKRGGGANVEKLIERAF